MAFENLISISFSATELQDLDQALQKIAAVLQGKTVNLTPAQRTQYGSIAEQNKLFVNKAKQLMEQNPTLVPSFLDKAEFDKDYAAREQIEGRLMQIAGLTEQMSDSKVLLDHDNYFNALSFYRSVKFLSQENVPGTSSVFSELRQFFGNGGSKTVEPAPPNPEE